MIVDDDQIAGAIGGIHASGLVQHKPQGLPSLTSHRNPNGKLRLRITQARVTAVNTILGDDGERFPETERVPLSGNHAIDSIIVGSASDTAVAV